jgi:hypothetical protein
MADDLVKRLHKWVDDLEHDCDYNLQFELSGEEAGDFAEDISGALTRIAKLEAALIDILKVPRSEASWGIALVIAHHALKEEGKDE